MPRKTKEQVNLENSNEPKKKTKKATKSTTSANKSTSKKTTTKKTLATKTSTRKSSSSTEKKTKAKKTTAKKTEAKKSTTKKATKKVAKILEPEYYDLPYRYNQTVVKVLAQTPTTLFVYWDISDEDRKNFEEQYGKDFFENTKPILIVHNDTLGYSFEVEINDFANSWYLHIADSKCDYRIELGRRPIEKEKSSNKLNNTDYIYITSSNEMETPNDKILFNKEEKLAYFKNVKTGNITAKSINNTLSKRSIEKIYNIYDIYKKIYKEENVEDIYDFNNPSS